MFLYLLQSDTHVILASLKRAPSELSSYTQKVFKIDDHMGIATAGLAADGRILCRYMRNECINHRQALFKRLCFFSLICPMLPAVHISVCVACGDMHFSFLKTA